jgi:DNA-binding NtrC family response regulator
MSHAIKSSSTTAQPSAVLIVDDDSIVLRLLTRMLDRTDYAVIACASAFEALDLISREPVCAVVSDISMPEMSGFGLLQKLRELYPTLPVLLMTGHADADYATLAIEHGAFAFLQKPFDAEFFRLTVDGAAEYYRAARSKRNSPTRESD